MDISKVIQEIQYILAPAFMISSAALLLLGFQNKFSALADRLRVLNHERQQLWQKPDRTPVEETRFRNLKDQVEHLFRRASLVKSAIFLTYGSIVFFTGTSLLILFGMHASRPAHVLIMATFATGLFFIFATAIIMLLESRLIYRVLVLEKKSWGDRTGDGR
jgi:polyferredoxin